MEEFLRKLGISDFLIETAGLLGYTHPTPIQETCIPQVLSGLPVQARAPTGTGKTAAYAIPLVELLSRDPYGVFALVLTPTRELAIQIEQQLLAFGARMNLKTECIVGGKDVVAQGQSLSKRIPHIVCDLYRVATPGRLSDLLTSQEDVRRVFHNLKYLVLDESDALKETQEEELGEVLVRIPQGVTTMEFSATLPGVPTIGTRAELTETFLLTPEAVRDAYLLVLLTRFSSKSTIVFVATCEHAESLYRLLSELRFNCKPLHSLISQRERVKNLDEFRSERTSVLIATDVASRGLDLPQVELVINHNFPRSSVLYTHRIGRTGRAGKAGMAISMVTQYDVQLVLHIEEKLSTKLAPLYTPEEITLFEDEVLKVLTKMTNTKAVVSHVIDTSASSQERIRRKSGDVSSEEKTGQNFVGKQEIDMESSLNRTHDCSYLKTLKKFELAFLCTVHNLQSTDPKPQLKSTLQAAGLVIAFVSLPRNFDSAYFSKVPKAVKTFIFRRLLPVGVQWTLAEIRKNYEEICLAAVDWNEKQGLVSQLHEKGLCRSISDFLKTPDSPETSGCIYIYKNPKVDGLVKIGRSSKDLPMERVRKQKENNLVNYRIICFMTTHRSQLYESVLHKELSEKRVHNDPADDGSSEWFRISVSEAVQKLRQIHSAVRLFLREKGLKSE